MNWRSCITTLLATFVVYPNCCCLLGAHPAESDMGGCGFVEEKALPKCCQKVETSSSEEKGDEPCPHQQGKSVLKQSTLVAKVLKPVAQKPLFSPLLSTLSKNWQHGDSPLFVTLEEQVFLRSPPPTALRKLHCRYII